MAIRIRAFLIHWYPTPWLVRSFRSDSCPRDFLVHVVVFIWPADHCDAVPIFLFSDRFFVDGSKRVKRGQIKIFTRDLNARSALHVPLFPFVFSNRRRVFTKYLCFCLLVVWGSLSYGGHHLQQRCKRQQQPPPLYWNSKQVEWLFFLSNSSFTLSRPWFVLMCFPTDEIFPPLWKK